MKGGPLSMDGLPYHDNPYAYAKDNSVNFSDPSGLDVHVNVYDPRCHNDCAEAVAEEHAAGSCGTHKVCSLLIWWSTQNDAVPGGDFACYCGIACVQFPPFAN
jgi:hypothetical protein